MRNQDSPSPVKIIIYSAMVIFIAGLLAGYLLSFFPKLTDASKMLLDSFLLTALISPILYFCFFRSMLQQMNERKQTEEVLQTSEQKLGRTQKIAKVGSWEWNITEDKTKWSKELYNIFGIKPEQLETNAYKEFINCISAEDRKQVDTVIKTAIDNRNHFDIDYRIIRQTDGATRYIHSRGNVTSNNSGNKIIVGTSQDITERKLVEEKIKYSLHEKEALLNEISQKNKELEKALTQVKHLSGLLPICFSCKKIRDDHGYWKQIEIYISDHSEADFSHGICPECLDKLFPEADEKNINDHS